MRKSILILLIFIASFVYADENIVTYKEDSLPVLNEELRKLKKDTRNTHSVPSGGTIDQVLSKVSATDYDTTWTTLPVPTVITGYSNLVYISTVDWPSPGIETKTFTVLSLGKFLKTAGIETITCYLSYKSGIVANNVKIRVDIGGVEEDSAGNDTVSYVEESITLDVSGLTDGTTYAITVKSLGTVNTGALLRFIEMIGT